MDYEAYLSRSTASTTRRRSWSTTRRTADRGRERLTSLDDFLDELRNAREACA